MPESVCFPRRSQNRQPRRERTTDAGAGLTCRRDGRDQRRADRAPLAVPGRAGRSCGGGQVDVGAATVRARPGGVERRVCEHWSARASTTWRPRRTRSRCSTRWCERRLRRRLTTVIDTLGLDAGQRAAVAGARRRAPACRASPSSFDVAAGRVPGPQPLAPAGSAVAGRGGAARSCGVVARRPRRSSAAEGFAAVHPARAGRRSSRPRCALAEERQTGRRSALRFGLQLPRFTWPGGPAELRLGSARSPRRPRRPASPASG